MKTANLANTLATIFGWISIILALVAIVPSMVSGVGIIIALAILVFSGLTAFSGKIRYAVSVLIITSINILFFSAASILWMPPEKTQALPEGIPPVEALPAIRPATIPEIAGEVASQSNIPIEELNRAGFITTKADSDLPTAQIANLLTLLAFPYLITILLVIIGYYSNKDSTSSPS